ncbi:MAG: lysophospholipid acyltransferase family protein [Gemmatimonadota bacterium]
MKARLAARAADFVRSLPRPLGEPAAAGIAVLLMATYGRSTALENIARVYPGMSTSDRWRLAFASYHQMARSLVEVLHGHRYTDEEIRRRVRLENVAALDEALSRGHGVILLSGHYGNWEWMGRRVKVQGHPFAALYKEPKDEGLGERLRATREAAGLVTIDHDDARGTLGWLRSGGALGIIMDQEPHRSRDGAVAPLFGHPTRTYVGPFKLARRVGAPVFTIFTRRVGPARYEGRLEPFPLSPFDDPDRAAAADAEAFNARLEAAIREEPDHWLWMYDRWKRLARHPEPALKGMG